MIATPVRAASPTERKIAEMLVENTGSNMLDSGGAYGRAWQHTRAAYGLDSGLPNSPWDGSPKTTHEPEVDEIERVALAMREQPSASIDRYGSYTLNTFHFLVEHLDFDPTLHDKYERWQRVTNFGKDRYDKDWGLPLMERFCDQLRKRAKVGGLYGDSSGPTTDNSYNSECALGRTIQFTLFTVENGQDWDGEWVNKPEFLPDGSYVLLQIHGGADVRGGYTDPVLFGMSDEYGLLDYARVYLFCEGNPDTITPGQIDQWTGRATEVYDIQHRWESENAGYSYNLDGMWGQGETTLKFDDYDEKGLKAIWDEDREVWLCPVEGCGAKLIA